MRCWPNKNEKLRVIMGKKKKHYSWLLNKESLKCLVTFTHGFFFSHWICTTVVKLKFVCPTHKKAKQTQTLLEWRNDYLLQGLARRKGLLMLKRPKLPNGLQGRSFYRQDLERGLQAVWLSSGLTAGKVTGWCFRNLNHQPSGSKVGSTCFAQAEVTILYLGGSLNSCRRTQRCVK